MKRITGEFKVEKARYKEPIRKKLVGVFVIFGCLWCFFSIIILLRKEDDMVSSFLLITSILGFFLPVWIAMLYVIGYPYNKTVLTISENEIIRSGSKLLTVRFKFDEIHEVKKTNDGLFLLKEGVLVKLGYRLNPLNALDNFGILFIPANIQNYDGIVQFFDSLK